MHITLPIIISRAHLASALKEYTCFITYKRWLTLNRWNYGVDAVPDVSDDRAVWWILGNEDVARGTSRGGRCSSRGRGLCRERQLCWSSCRGCCRWGSKKPPPESTEWATILKSSEWWTSPKSVRATPRKSVWTATWKSVGAAPKSVGAAPKSVWPAPKSVWPAPRKVAQKGATKLSLNPLQLCYFYTFVICENKLL